MSEQRADARRPFGVVRQVAHLLAPRWRSVATRLRTDGEWTLRLAGLTVVAVLFWGVTYGVTAHVLRYLGGVAGLGTVIASKLLALTLLSLFGVAAVSASIGALSTFFLAHDLEIVASAPVDWRALFVARVAEVWVAAGWVPLLVAAPVLGAYGVTYQGGAGFALVAAALLVPYLTIAAGLGIAVVHVLVRVLPARRAREALGAAAGLAAVAGLVLVRVARPEQFVRPSGPHAIADMLASLRAPGSPLLPSEWAARGLMAWLQYDAWLRPLALLWGGAAAALVLAAVLHRATHAAGVARAARGAGTQRVTRGAAERLLASLRPSMRQLLLKEGRVFVRDSAQWSQLALLAVLIVVYVLNVRLLPAGGAGLAFLLANVVPLINIALTGFVLSALAARFVFPGVSLEGGTWWLLRASPIAMRELLWAKFWSAAVPLVFIAATMVLATDVFLGVAPFMMAVSAGSVALLTAALVALALAVGALFPRFDAENAAQVQKSAGAAVYMMAAAALTIALVVIEATPVYVYVAVRGLGETPDTSSLVTGLGTAGALCICVTAASLGIAARRVDVLER